MNPLSLRARNFRTFEELDLDLPSGVTAIVGVNGAGKSSIVSIVDLCLFGPESRSLADCLSDDATDTELEIELTFEHGGEIYRVRRGYSARGRGKSTTDFEHYPIIDVDGLAEGGGWVPLTRERQDATEALVEQTLGLSRATFRASCFLAQGDSGAFTEAQPRERKAILAEVLGLSSWERLLDLAKGKRRVAQQQLDSLAGRIETREEEIARMPDVERDLAAYAVTCERAAEELASAEVALEGARARYTAAEARLSERRTAEAKLQAARAVLDPLLAAAREAFDAKANVEVAEEELATLTTSAQLAAVEQTYSEARAEYDCVQHERQVIEAKIANAEETIGRAHEEEAVLWAQRNALVDKARNLELAGASDAVCDRCERPLDDPEVRRRAARSYRAEAEVLEERMAALSAAAKEHETQSVGAKDALTALGLVALPDETAVQKARADQSERARLEERIGAWRRQIEDVEKPGFESVLVAAREEVALAEKLLADLPLVDAEECERIQREGLAAKAAVEAKREELRIAGEQKARAEAELERLALLAAATAADRLTRDALLAEVDVLATLERAYGPNGVPALIVENVAIPQIEVEANRILAELGTPYRVELRTQRALKSSDALADTLDVVVFGEGGSERAYETFSGGERSRINVALRIALARLLAHRRGAESRILCLDEVEYLDEAGQAALVDVLRGLLGDFDKVLLVSHVPGLRDAFDSVIEVVKDGGRSRIETGAMLEAAAA